MTLKWNNKYFETQTFLHQDAHFTPGNEWLLHALSHSRFFLSLPTSCFHFLEILKNGMLLWKLYPALTRSWQMCEGPRFNPDDSSDHLWLQWFLLSTKLLEVFLSSYSHTHRDFSGVCKPFSHVKTLDKKTPDSLQLSVKRKKMN